MQILTQKEYSQIPKPIKRPAAVANAAAPVEVVKEYEWSLFHAEYLTKRSHKFGEYEAVYGSLRVRTESEAEFLQKESGFQLLSKSEVADE